MDISDLNPLNYLKISQIQHLNDTETETLLAKQEIDSIQFDSLLPNTPSPTNDIEKPKTCRLCLSISENDSIYSLNIYKEMNLDENIACIIARHFPFIQPVETDEFSKDICCTCWTNLHNFHKFYEKIRIAHYYLSHSENIFTQSIKIEEMPPVKMENPEAKSCDKDSHTNKNISKLSIKIQSDKRKKRNISPPSITKTGKKNNVQQILMPNHFDEQDKTDDIFQRFHEIRPFMFNEKKNVFQCNYCNIVFKHRKTIINHVKKHNALPYVCPEGDERFQSLQETMDHIKKMHTTIDDSTVCSICGKTSLSKTALKLHLQSVHRPIDQPKVQCNECGHWLQDKNILKIHIRRQHGANSEPKKCDICSTMLTSARNLARHIRRYHDKVLIKHTCSICSKEFHYKQRLKEHMSAIHAGEPLYQCNYCSKSFNVRSNYYTHRKRMHPEELQKIHEKREAENVIKTNEIDMTDLKIFKYNCTWCTKEFQFKQQLKEHVAADHAGNSPIFQCEFCPEKFHIRESYSSHTRLVHPDEFKKIKKEKATKRAMKLGKTTQKG